MKTRRGGLRRGGYLSLGSTNKSLKTLNKSLHEVIETLVTEDDREKLCSIWGARYSGNPSFDTVTLMKSMQTHPSFFKHLLGTFAVLALGARPLMDKVTDIQANLMYKDAEHYSENNNPQKADKLREDAHILKGNQWADQYHRSMKQTATMSAIAAIPLSVLAYGVSLFTGYFEDYKKSKETVAIIEKAIQRAPKMSPQKTRSSRR